METATPSSKDFLRRSTFMEASMLHNNSSIIELSNDDDERTERRNELRIQRDNSSVDSSPRSDLSDSYITGQFRIYTHLFTKNFTFNRNWLSLSERNEGDTKITIKNAWSVKIIDMLRPLCQRSGQDVLQVACTSIDISAKVYGIRVDDVHSEGLKLASNMSRMSEEAGTPEQDDEDGPEEGTDPAVATKKIKKKKFSAGQKTTIINNNPNAHLAKLSKLEPTDFRARVNSETGTIDNLFSNVLKETGSSFVLLDKTKRLLETIDTTVKNDNKTALSDCPLPQTNCSTCAPLRDFILDQWDPEQEKLILNPDESVVLSQMQPAVFDDDGFPVPEHDVSIIDHLENMDSDDMGLNDDEENHVHEKRCEEAPAFCSNISKVVDFRPSESDSQLSEYSFNSLTTTNNGNYIDQIWAGPSHWKIKFMRRSNQKFAGRGFAVTKKRRNRRRERSPDMIDFFEEPEEVDFSKKLRVNKRARAVDIDQITLPLKYISFEKLIEDIRELILRPGVCVVPKKHKRTNNVDYEVDPYNYENPIDNLYCSVLQPDDDVNDSESYENIEEDEPILCQRAENLADNLVDNPEMVPNTYAHYALRAKHIDMKKLGKVIWLKLTDSVGANSKAQKDAVVPQNFSSLYKSLPSLLSGREKAQLSCPLAFVALLHLCNENKLHLIQLPGYNDFEIRLPST